MIILIDGPDKVGKTTLVNEFRDMSWRVRHWGPIDDDQVYLDALKFDVTMNDNVVWDRGWPAEHVYSKLYNRDRRFKDDPWLSWWLYGRAVQAMGTTQILVHEPAELEAMWDSTDPPVELVKPAVALFAEYARTGGSRAVWTRFTTTALRSGVGQLMVDASTNWLRAMRYGTTPPHYAGPQDARVVFVGEARSDPKNAGVPGGWLPFTSRLTEKYGRILGADAFKCGWTNALDCNPAALRDADLLVACGDKALKWCQRAVNHGNILHVPHPAYLYRWGRTKGLIEPVEREIVRRVTLTLRNTQETPNG